ncbi:hypothetical protein CYMTET_47863, partial [Cymbomonas tetramitiformis]
MPAPLRLINQTWDNGPFDPRTMLPSTFQGTYEPESETGSVDTTTQSVWLDAEQVADIKIQQPTQWSAVPVGEMQLGPRERSADYCSQQQADAQICFLARPNMARWADTCRLGDNPWAVVADSWAQYVTAWRACVEDGDELAAAIQRHVAVGVQQRTLHVL